jgi:hypothetical protein
MYDALFRQTGVIRAQTFGDLLDIPAALATGRVLRGKRVAILTSTGGAGTLVSDSLGVSGFETPVPDEPTAAALRALQTGDHAALDRNPIDVTLAGLQPDLLRGAIKALLASPTYDALVVIVGSSGVGRPAFGSTPSTRRSIGSAGTRDVQSGKDREDFDPDDCRMNRTAYTPLMTTTLICAHVALAALLLAATCARAAAKRAGRQLTPAHS